MDGLALIQAAQEGDLEKVRFFVNSGFSEDIRGHCGRTPLHCAAVLGWYQVVDLLSSIRSINLRDKDGKTPVLLAAEVGKKDIVDLLLGRGAQVNCSDNLNRTLLHHASRQGWSNVVQHVVDSGEADLNAASRFGWTPLMLAVSNMHEDVAELLIRAGADVHQSNCHGWTALHLAARDGNVEVVRLLMEVEGLDLNHQDKEGETPLHKACCSIQYFRAREVRKLLMEAGCDTSVKNNVGETAFCVIIRKLKLPVRDILVFVQNGAFIDRSEYALISQFNILKGILKDVDLCTLSIVNKYHHQTLPALYKCPYFAKQLPSIDHFKLNFQQINVVENLVKCEIKANTFCNIAKARPRFTLSLLCIHSLWLTSQTYN